MKQSAIYIVVEIHNFVETNRSRSCFLGHKIKKSKDGGQPHSEVRPGGPIWGALGAGVGRGPCGSFFFFFTMLWSNP